MVVVSVSHCPRKSHVSCFTADNRRKSRLPGKAVSIGSVRGGRFQVLGAEQQQGSSMAVAETTLDLLLIIESYMKPLARNQQCNKIRVLSRRHGWLRIQKLISIMGVHECL